MCSGLPLQLMNLIGIICVACAYNAYVSQATFFDFVASTGIIVAVILGVLYVFHVREKVAQLLRLNLVVSRRFEWACRSAAAPVAVSFSSPLSSTQYWCVGRQLPQ